MRLLRSFGVGVVFCVLAGPGVLPSAGQEQYSKPLLHTAADHPAERVVLLVVDGLNAIDLALWTQTHPASALAELSGRGVTFTNAHVPSSDEAGGLLALVTGGTSISTGIVSGNGYDRALSPPGSACHTIGSPLPMDHTLLSPDGLLAPAKMPLNPQRGCTPVFPHDLVKVNNIFEVMKERGGRTAWAGRSAALADLYAGPSGKGLSETCAAGPEDAGRLLALMHWIDGKDCTGKLNAAVPIVMGAQWTAVAQAKSSPSAAYADATGTPALSLTKAIETVDARFGSLIAELKARKLFASTWIVITSAYGEAPTTVLHRRRVSLYDLETVAGSGTLVHLTTGGTAMLWLKDPSTAAAVAKSLSSHAAALGIARIDAAATLALTSNVGPADSRMPDLILHPAEDARWTPASPGSATDEDAHVALLVSGAQFTGRVDKTPVPTTQLAPLLLRALGMEKFDLQALHLEHSPALPGIF